MASTTKIASAVVSDVAHEVKGHVVAIASRVVDLHEAPDWMRQDHLITRAYRKQQDSFRGCFESLFYIHNETVNIWSHLGTGIFFLALATWAAFPALHGGHAFATSDLRALQTYLVGATICCMFSV